MTVAREGGGHNRRSIGMQAANPVISELFGIPWCIPGLLFPTSWAGSGLEDAAAGPNPDMEAEEAVNTT